MIDSNTLKIGAVTLVQLLVLSACGSSDDDSGGNSGNSGNDSSNMSAAGAVYAMTNGADVNTIVAYARASDGTLSLIGGTDTEGQGTGPNNVASGPGGNVFDPLASNFSLKMSQDNQYVFAVNAGSDQVSSLAVNADLSLTHVSTVSSGGGDPVSIATNGTNVFVANTNEGVGSLVAYSVGSDGSLSQVGDSIALQGRPTAIIMSADNTTLIAALVDTNQLQVFDVMGGTLTQTQLFSFPAPADGRVVANPFGLAAFERDGNQLLVVAEARVFTTDNEAEPQTSSVSTYSLSAGMLTPISQDIRADDDNDDSVGPITSCWAITNPDGSLVITANTFSSNLSAFAIDETGNATLSVSAAFQDPAEDFADVGLTDQIWIDGVVYQLAASTGDVISLQASATGQLTEIDRESGDLSLIGGNQGIAGF